MRRKKYGRIIFVCLCLLFVSGCGRRASGDEIAKDLQNEETASAGNADVDADENLQAQENAHTEYEITGEKNSVITVDADIIGLDKLQDMHFYDVTCPEMDETYIKSETESIFDKDTCEFYKPYNYSDAEELARVKSALISDCEAEEDPVMKRGMDNELAQVEQWEYYVQSEREETDVQLLGDVMYEETFAGGYQTHNVSAKGKIDGIPFTYEYFDSCGPENADYFARVNLTRYDYIGETQHVMLLSEEQLAAKMEDFPVSEEQAKGQAEDFLERIGYTGFACREIGYVENMTRLANQEEKQDGYFLVYTRSLDGLTTVCCPGSILRCWMAGELQAAAEVIYVLVNEDGVIQVRKEGQFYSVASEGSKTESYLSWEQVEDAAVQFLQTFDMQTTISEIKLSYAYVQYQSGQYCLVPVWSFYGASGLEGSHFIFGINAVDGEIIAGVYYMMVTDVFVL